MSQATNTLTVTLPDIGEGVVEGEVVHWLKAPGDPLHKDEAVVVVMTDKATVELPAPAAGTLSRQYYEEGQVARVGQPLYDIALAAAQLKTTAAAAPPAPCRTPTPASSATAQHSASPHEASDGVLALPATRRLAQQLHVDLNAVNGSGRNGRIEPHDLLSQAEQAPPPAAAPVIAFADDERVKISGVRRLMLKKMAEAHRLIPHFSYFESVDATRLIQLRQTVAAEAQHEGIHLTYVPFFLRALSLTLQRFPQLNATVDEEHSTLLLHKHHNIGIAMSSAEGLIVPVLKELQAMRLRDIIHAYEELKAKAKSQKLSPDDMRHGTVTISNFGALGGDGVWASPVINSPEVAILAIAKIAPAPVAVNGQVVVRDMLNLSWSFDHRVIDGQLAAQASHHLALLLTNPAQLL